jgi:hypothetical protein
MMAYWRNILASSRTEAASFMEHHTGGLRKLRGQTGGENRFTLPQTTY